MSGVRSGEFRFLRAVCLVALLVAAGNRSVRARQTSEKIPPQPSPATETYGRPAEFQAESPEDETVHVEAGTRLWSRPDARAVSVIRVDAAIDLPVLERTPGWVKVRYDGRIGWLPSGSDRSPTERKIADLQANPVRLARARQLLGAEHPVRRCGPLPLYTDVEDPALLQSLDKVARTLPAAYEARYGLSATGDPVEAIILFQRREDFQAFASSETSLGGVQVAGFARDGLAVIYRGEQTVEDIEHDLVHEMVHLLNRRVFGLSLPPWLEEGVANDLSYSRLDADGVPVPDSLSGSRREREIGHYEPGGWLSVDKQVRERGAVASLARLARLAESGELPEVSRLTRATWQDFTAEVDRQRRYDEAAFLVRFLLDRSSPTLRATFLASLRMFANDPTRSAAALDPTRWQTSDLLSSRFVRWLVKQQENIRTTPEKPD